MNRIIGLVFILGLSVNVSAQKKVAAKDIKTTQDSINVFYDALFSALKKGYLHRNAVNWPLIEEETNQDLKKYDGFKNSLQEVKLLFDRIKATHCIVYDKGTKYAATGKAIVKESFSEQWKKKFDSKPGFEARLLDGKYGYILMPPMVFFDISSDHIHQIAQPLYDQIAKIKTNPNVSGWIVDLRMNTGGNSWPMLLALYDLLGDNAVGGSLNLDKKQISTIRLANGKYLFDKQKISYINPEGELLDQAKVAVITGPITGSSGEVTAMAFKGRANTCFIGENTLGFTTGNMSWPLPFDITMALTISYDCDRNGNYYETITPDIAVSRLDNFDDLLLDGNIKEAFRFLEHKE